MKPISLSPLLSSQGHVLWLTGLPGSGKSTLAQALIGAFQEEKQSTLWLDSDALRQILTPQATYDPHERAFFYKAIAHIAWLGCQGGSQVVISATAHKQQFRDALRQQIPQQFMEIYLVCQSDILKQRDIKGLYQQSAKGLIQQLPGEGEPYEPPQHAELTLDSSQPVSSLLHRCLQCYQKLFKQGH